MCQRDVKNLNAQRDGPPEEKSQMSSADAVSQSVWLFVTGTRSRSQEFGIPFRTALGCEISVLADFFSLFWL